VLWESNFATGILCIDILNQSQKPPTVVTCTKQRIRSIHPLVSKVSDIRIWQPDAWWKRDQMLRLTCLWQWDLVALSSEIRLFQAASSTVSLPASGEKRCRPIALKLGDFSLAIPGFNRSYIRIQLVLQPLPRLHLPSPSCAGGESISSYNLSPDSMWISSRDSVSRLSLIFHVYPWSTRMVR